MCTEEINGIDDDDGGDNDDDNNHLVVYDLMYVI